MNTPPLTIDIPDGPIISDGKPKTQEINYKIKDHEAGGYKLIRVLGTKTEHPDFFIVAELNRLGYSGFWLLIHGESGLQFPEAKFETLHASRHLAGLLKNMDAPWDDVATGEYKLGDVENSMCTKAVFEALRVDEDAVYGTFARSQEAFNRLYDAASAAVSEPQNPITALKALRDFLEES